MSLDTLLTQAAFGFDSWKRSCRAVSVFDVTPSGETTIDDVAINAGDRVLLTAQANAAQNGPHIVQLGAWTRPPEFDASADVVFGSTWRVLEGTTYAGTTWSLTSPVSGIVTLGSTALTIEQDPSGGASGVEAPTPSTVVKRTSTGLGRLAALAIEGASDAGRWIAGLLADGATLARLTYYATEHFIRGQNASAGGLLITPTTAGNVLTLAAVEDNGSTAKPLDITCSAFTVNGSPVGGGSGTEAPTPSTVVQRTAAGVGRFGGLTLETDTDGDRKIAAYAADGTTAATLAIVAETVSVTADSEVDITGPSGVIVSSSGACEVHAGTHSRSDASGNFACSEVPAAARTIAYPNTTTSLTDTIAQAASGAGGTRTMRSGLGASGSAPGKCSIGVPDGGTVLATTAVEMYTGDVIANVSAPVAVADEVGTHLKLQRFGATGGQVCAPSGQAINVGVDGSSTTQGLNVSGSSVGLRAQSGILDLFAASSYISVTGPSGFVLETLHPARVATSTATTSNLVTATIPTNEGWCVGAVVGCRNTTNGTFRTFIANAPATMWVGKNIAGTVTQIQDATPTEVGDADAGTAVDFDFTGTTFRVRVTSPDTDARTWTAVPFVYRTI